MTTQIVHIQTINVSDARAAALAFAAAGSAFGGIAPRALGENIEAAGPQIIDMPMLAEAANAENFDTNRKRIRERIIVIIMRDQKKSRRSREVIFSPSCLELGLHGSDEPWLIERWLLVRQGEHQAKSLGILWSLCS